MYKFKSPVIHDNIWKVYLRSSKELNEMSNKDYKKEDTVKAILDYINLTIYIDKDLDDIEFKKTLREKLINLYLWETGQQCHIFTLEDFCELTSVAAPLICETADYIVAEIKNKNKKGAKK